MGVLAGAAASLSPSILAIWARVSENIDQIFNRSCMYEVVLHYRYPILVWHSIARWWNRGAKALSEKHWIEGVWTGVRRPLLGPNHGYLGKLTVFINVRLSRLSLLSVEDYTRSQFDGWLPGWKTLAAEARAVIVIDDDKCGSSEVLLSLPLLVHGVQNWLSFSVVSPPQVIYLLLHLAVKTRHPEDQGRMEDGRSESG